MNRTLISIACSLPLLAAQIGCVHEGAYQPVKAGEGNIENTAKFVLLDPSVQKSVTCSGLQESRGSDGRLRVKANVRNRESRRIEVQINCVFKDEQGFTLDETPFESLILTGNETRGVEYQAMNDKARGYTIRVRQAR